MAMAIERGNSFHLLLSDDELKLLKLLAEREGLNASDYLRLLIRRQADTPAHAQLLSALIAGKVLGADADYAIREGVANVIREGVAKKKR
jgi:hypothetical protein